VAGEEKKVDVLDTAAQIDLKEELETLWLTEMKNRIKNNTATSTDLATLARVLMANGWTLDPKDLPQSLKDKLTSRVSTDELDDTGVIPFRKQA
jgi:nitrogen fixation protein